MALGLGSRLAGLALFGDMVMAMITVTWATGIDSPRRLPATRVNLALGVLALVIAVFGAGRFSLDALAERHLVPRADARAATRWMTRRVRSRALAPPARGACRTSGGRRPSIAGWPGGGGSGESPASCPPGGSGSPDRGQSGRRRPGPHSSPGPPAVLPADPPPDRRGVLRRADVGGGCLPDPTPGPDGEPTAGAIGSLPSAARSAACCSGPVAAQPALGGRRRAWPPALGLAICVCVVPGPRPLLRFRRRRPGAGETWPLRRRPPSHLRLLPFAPVRVPAAEHLGAERRGAWCS